VLAAEGPEGLIGYSAGLRTLDAADGPHGEIFTLYLLRAAQRRGLGRRLLASGARVLAAEGARSLRLWVLSANESAREFYQRLGGAQGAERPVGGWGGGLMETVYTWSDIGVLARADA
jgi:ribosomal protein S18 acetylase RimI-like enzyme